jgi:phage-related protein
VTTTAITNGAMTFAKEGSNAVARAAVDRAMASPVAAMMIGAGLLMLMVGDKKVGSAVGSLVEQGKSAVKSATDAATSTVSGLADKVTGSADKASGQVKDALAEGQQQGQQVLQQAQQLFEQNRGKLEQFAQEQPILVAALGVAFGAALGASLPLTKAEQQYLADPAKKVASKGGEIAQKVADTLTDKLAGQNVDHKIGEVVEAVSSTVTQSLSRS